MYICRLNTASLGLDCLLMRFAMQRTICTMPLCRTAGVCGGEDPGLPQLHRLLLLPGRAAAGLDCTDRRSNRGQPVPGARPDVRCYLCFLFLRVSMRCVQLACFSLSGRNAAGLDHAHGGPNAGRPVPGASPDMRTLSSCCCCLVAAACFDFLSARVLSPGCCAARLEAVQRDNKVTAHTCACAWCQTLNRALLSTGLHMPTSLGSTSGTRR